MTLRPLAAVGAIVLIAGAIGLAVSRGGAIWWPHTNSPDADQPGEPAGLTAADPGTRNPPVTPDQPRLSDDEQYNKCVNMIADDPEGAEAIATSWQASGGGDAAIHCQALAMVAAGQPEAGATTLENLAHGGKATKQNRTALLGQAAEARLMAEQAEPALKDATEALAISPDDADLLISHANANDALERLNDAMADLNHVLLRDPSRGEALVLRASLWRRMDKPDKASADINKALTLDPEDAEALLERGILRQAMGDLAGARADWTHARTADPNSEAAELAQQNLTLLDAGPSRK